MHLRIFLLLFMGGLFQKAGVAQTSYPLFYDKDQSMQFGANNLLIAHKAIYSFQDEYIPDSLWRESNFKRKCLGFGYRMSKLFLLDFQQDYLFYLTQHEVFGHGARYREFGSKNNRYELSMFYPFGNGSGSAMWGTIYPTTPHKEISSSIAGVQANQVLASTLLQQILLGGEIHYRQGLLYLLSQNDQLLYTWTDYYKSLNGKTGGDMNGYVNKLNTLYFNQGKTYSLNKMSLQSLVSIINPMQLYAAFTILYVHGIKGEKKLSHIPMIKLGKIQYLPFINFNISPFGGEYILSNNFKFNHQLWVMDFGISDHYFDNTYRLSLKAFNLLKFPKNRINLHFNIWNQPELELQETTGTFVPKEKNVFGGSIATDLIFNPVKSNPKFGFYSQIGYKTKGFEAGTQLDKGLILKYGLNFSF